MRVIDANALEKWLVHLRQTLLLKEKGLRDENEVKAAARMYARRFVVEGVIEQIQSGKFDVTAEPLPFEPTKQELEEEVQR